jgi:hypothetical protein
MSYGEKYDKILEKRNEMVKVISSKRKDKGKIEVKRIR